MNFNGKNKRMNHFLIPTQMAWSVDLQESSGESRAAAVFKKEHFPAVPPEDCGLCEEEYQRYKQSFLGKPIPPPKYSDEQLHAAGYTDWIHFCVEFPILNWS